MAKNATFNLETKSCHILKTLIKESGG